MPTNSFAAIIRFLKRSLFQFLALSRVGRYESKPTISGYTRFNRATELGRNTNFNGLVVYGFGRVKIGSNFHSGSGCKVITMSHNYNGECVPYDSSYQIFNVEIEDNVWLGMDVTIIGNVRIGEGAIIQVGSVVVSDIPKFAIAGGHPARVFKMRDQDKYAALVKGGKFH